MPQLDITINLIWFLSTVLVIGVLYLHWVYVYVPFFVRSWKLKDYYVFYLKLVTLSVCSKYIYLLGTTYYYLTNSSLVVYHMYGSLRDIQNTYSLEVFDSDHHQWRNSKKISLKYVSESIELNQSNDSAYQLYNESYL